MRAGEPAVLADGWERRAPWKLRAERDLRAGRKHRPGQGLPAGKVGLT
jgi:hypothetical protein